MSTITAILDPDADGTLHLPLPVAWRNLPIRVKAEIEPAVDSTVKEAGERNSLFEIMERIARRNPFKAIHNPIAWQREMRDDVVLPWPPVE